MSQHPSSPFRLPRPQFSLRALLLLMFLVGVGIMIYRWPWEVTRELPDGSTVKTRYRRSWNGKAVKHGREVLGDLQHVGWEGWYDEGDLRLDRSWHKGVVESEGHYRAGERHGPFWQKFDNDGQIRGEFQQGKFHGEWLNESYDLIQRDHRRDDQLHGRSTWETKTGELLQSAEYEQGKLTKWNDLPFPQALEKWSADHAVAPHVRQFLLTRIDDNAAVQHRFTDSLIFEFQYRDQAMVVCLQNMLWDNNVMFAGRLFGEVLVEEALEHTHTFAYRFNTLHLVPISARSFAWQDRTGVYDVKFPADSPQEKFWLQALPEIPHWALSPAGRIRQMLYSGDDPLTGQLISVEVPRWLEPEDSSLTARLSTPKVPRLRRDYLAQYLDREECYVVQEGNKLIIKRHADRQ